MSVLLPEHSVKRLVGCRNNMMAVVAVGDLHPHGR